MAKLMVKDMKFGVLESSIKVILRMARSMAREL